jgi:hypothetical protein
MLTLHYAQGTASAKGANKLAKAIRERGIAGHFEIRRANGNPVAVVDLTEQPTYAVSIDGNPEVRTIGRDEVVNTARLYVEANRLRKSLNKVGCMTIRPVAA